MTKRLALIGIDIGTSGSKGVAVTTSGDLLAKHNIEHGLSVPRPGWAEHDADAIWWHDFCVISRLLMETVRTQGYSLAGVGCSAIGPTMLPLDRDGRPLRPAILYGIDTRASAEIDILNETLGAENVFNATGQLLTSQSVGPKILWFKRNEPDLFRRTNRIATATTYLVYRLTGEFVVCKYVAPFFGPLFNVERMAWDEDLARDICPIAWLPEPRWATEEAGLVTGEAEAQSGIPAGTPVAVGTVDAAAEAVSVGAVEPGDAMVMYGTTLFLMQALARYTKHRNLWASVFCVPGRAALSAGMATSGAITRWFRDEFGQVELEVQQRLGLNAYSLLAEQAAHSPPGSNGLVTLPYFSGERTPLNDPDARGLIAGLTLKHGRGDIYRSILEGTACGLRHNLATMAEAGALPRRLVAVGGGVKNPLWLQIASDVTGIPQDVPNETLGAPIGDAYLGGLASGVFSDLETLKVTWVKIERTVQPNFSLLELYDNLYDIYRQLYEVTKKEVHRLARLQS